MRSFAGRTGLTSDRPKQRYLWTDAFAVCNFLGLARLTGERSYADLALRLVDQVHHVLGRHGDWQQPASRRLAFRELGLAIGLAAMERLRKDTDEGRGAVRGDEVRARLHALGSHVGLRSRAQ